MGAAAFGLIAGIGGAVFLIGAAKTGPVAGVWPVLAIQVAAMVTTALVAAVTGNLRIPGPGARGLSVSSGCIGAGAALLYIGAAHAGMLAIAAAVTGLFPVATVALARVVEKERLGATRLAGLAMATVAVALIGIGR
jgi:drug/metabolite transporter (DMT)-like permease